MSNKIITAKTTIDIRAEQLQPYFGSDLLYTDPYWYCTECEDGVGSEPGYARIIIGNNQNVVDEVANSVYYNPDGPAAQIKHGSPVAIRRRYTDTTGNRNASLIWAGKVVKIKPRPDIDGLELLALDARDKLKDIRVIGRYMYDPTTSQIYYQQGWSSHFNPGGRPNCIFTPGGTPVFAPYPDYGLATDEEPPDPSQLSTTKACYWTLRTELLHFRAFYAYESPEDTLAAVARTSAKTAWPMIQRFPDWVTWPIGFGSDLDTIAQTNFDNAVGQNNSSLGGSRKGRDLQVKGHSFIGNDESGAGIFDMIFDAAGGWTYYLDYLVTGSGVSGISNILTAVPKRWLSAATAIDLPLAVGGNAKDTLKDLLIISDSDYEESSETTITRAAAVAALIKIETLCSTRGADHPSGIPALLPAWTDADLNAMLTLAVTLGGGSIPTLDSFNQAAAKYPWVLTTWVLNGSFDFQANTSEAGKSQAPITRPIWPTLLSFAGTATKTNDIMPYPVRSEVYDGSAWNLGPEQDGLQIFDNGVIYMPGLRDVVAQTDGNSKGSFRFNVAPWSVNAGKLDITVNDVRATIAIPCDHRLSYIVRTVSEQGEDSPSVALLDDSPDIEKLDSSFVRSIFVDLGSLYDVWLRYNSAYVPQTAGGAIATNYANGNSSTTALRSDIDQMQSHVNRMLVDKFGLSVNGGWYINGSFVTTIKPGTAITNLSPVGGAATRKPVTVRRVIGRRRWEIHKTHDEYGNDIFINRTKLIPI